MKFRPISLNASFGQGLLVKLSLVLNSLVRDCTKDKRYISEYSSLVLHCWMYDGRSMSKQKWLNTYMY